jgi:hypothetical protein
MIMATKIFYHNALTESTFDGIDLPGAERHPGRLSAGREPDI